MRKLLAIPLLLLVASAVWAGRAVVEWRGGVNVRSTPDTRVGKIKEKIPAGTEAETLEARDGWVRVRYPGGEGWVVGRSLRTVADSTPGPARTEEPPPVRPDSTPEGPESPSLQSSPPSAVPPVKESSAPPPSQRGGYLSGYDQESGPATVETGPGLFTVVSALLLVLALVAGAVYLIKILSGRRYFGATKGRGIQVLAARPLGPRQALVLVEVGGIPLLLAQGETGISLIAEIRDPEALRRLNDLYGFRETPFEAELHRRLDLESEPGGEEGSGSDGPALDHPPPGYWPESAVPDPSPEERLAALRRRRSLGEGP